MALFGSAAFFTDGIIGTRYFSLSEVFEGASVSTWDTWTVCIIGKQLW